MILIGAWALFGNFEMARRGKLEIVQAALLNWLMLILIILMIASVFSVLLIKGAVLKERQVSLGPQKALAAVCCGTSLPGLKS